MTHRAIGSIGVTLLLLAVTKAAAQPNKCFEFDLGVLPTADPQIEYASVGGLSEAAAFSVAADMLHQTLIPVTGPTGYFYPAYPGIGGDLTPSLPLVIEARLRVVEIQNFGGVWFGALDGANDYKAQFSSSGVSIETPGGPVLVPVDVFQFHTYRIESPADSTELRLYIDGILQLTTNAGSQTRNGFRWGGGTSFSSATGNATWDFVRFSQLGPFCPPCLAADLDGDGFVAIPDLLLLLAQWGVCPPICLGDINGDGSVNVPDLLLLLAAWGACP